MPEINPKPLLLAAGALGSVLLARYSKRSSRNRAAQRDRERRLQVIETVADNATLEFISPGAGPSNCAGSANEGSGISPTGTGILLLCHGLLSLALLYLATLWHPSHTFTGESWRQFIGSILITLFSMHAITFYLWPFLFRRAPPPAPAAVLPAAAASRPETIQDLNGVWMKDKHASDSMDPVCDLMKLNALLRVAIGLIKGVEIEATPGAERPLFRIDVLSGVLWFKIKEKYKLDGEEARHRRRDFRGGGSFGRAMPAEEGGVKISHRFNPPMAGSMEERFYCPSPGVLYVDTLLSIPERGPPLNYRDIYRKRES